jgi:hypothetical protein
MTLNSFSLADLADTIARFGRGVLTDGKEVHAGGVPSRDREADGATPEIPISAE